MKIIVTVSLMVSLSVATQAQGEGSGVRLTPDNVDKQRVRIVIQLSDRTDSKEVFIIVEDRQKREAPVVVAWLQVFDGKTQDATTQILACQLATEKLASYEFGKGVSVVISPKLLGNCRILLEYAVKGKPEGSKMYWFDPKDFLKPKQQGTPKR